MKKIQSLSSSRALGLLLIFIAGCGGAFAQGRPGGGAPGQQGGSGKVTGRVVESGTGVAVPYASVAVLSAGDGGVVGGVLSDSDGGFQVTDLAWGQYRLQISFMGYETYRSEPFRLNPGMGGVFAAGTLTLTPSVTALDAAEVVEERSTLEMMIDRRVFNVGSDLGSAGSTATELLRNVPSVQVDIDGNISLRGSGNVQILIDGRPSGMTGAGRTAFLDAIPAGSIERVEIITNPSARYDPDGMAGILNIVLKKNKLAGFNGQIQGSLGTANNPSANGSLNYRSEHWNFFSSASWNQRDVFTRGDVDRLLTLADSSSVLVQRRNGNHFSPSASGRIGAEWMPGEGTVVSANVNYSASRPVHSDTLRNDETWDTDYITSSRRISSEISEEDGWDLDLGYRREFDESRRHLLTGTVRQSRTRGWTEQDIAEEALGLPAGTDSTQVTDFNHQEDLRDRTVVALDYERPMPLEGKLELGWKSNLNTTTNRFEYLEQDSLAWVNGLYIPYGQREAGYGFTYREDVHALYGTYGAKRGVYGWQLGLRLEQVFTEATLAPDSGSTPPPFRNDYFAAYPSVNLSMQRDDEQTWALSYSRRVNRPGGMQVNPFVDDSDIRNIRIGNPELRPEFTHSLELSHQWSRGKSSLTTSLFFKQTTDVIRWYRTINDLGITTSTFVNLDSRHDEGLETVLLWPIGKSGSVRMTGSIYYLTNNVSGLEAASSNSGWSWNVNGFANIPLGKVWKCQITEMYMGPSVTPQGRFEGFHSTDVAVQRSWSQRGLDLSLRVSDVFDTRQWAYSTVTSNFEQEAIRKRQSRMGFVTLTWKFGKMEPGRGRGRGDGMPGGGFEGGGGEF